MPSHFMVRGQQVKTEDTLERIVTMLEQDVDRVEFRWGQYKITAYRMTPTTLRVDLKVVE